MPRRLDIGIASYGNPQRLQQTLLSLKQQCRTDWRCFVIDNPSDSPQVRGIIKEAARVDGRFEPVFLEENVGYAGAVNELFRRAETEYIAYCDNDIQIQNPGWDELLCQRLDQFHEIGMIFPNGGAYQIPRGNYTEIMWGVGFCWVLNRMAMTDAGNFDESLGHQEEADYALRIRMAGYKCASLPEVHVLHHATATNSPAATERISRGVVNWVNKWCRYFGGKNLNYHSPNVLRWEDWPPNALYLEEYWRMKIGEVNSSPEVRSIDGRDYDMIQVPRLSGFYRNRII
jgi:GT2 family glycosyltransferase